jgi:hypothetical protein
MTRHKEANGNYMDRTATTFHKIRAASGPKSLT